MSWTNVKPRLVGRAELEKALHGPTFIVAYRHEIKLVVEGNIISAIERVVASRGPIPYVWAAKLGSNLEKYEWAPATIGTWVKAK